MQHKAGNTRQEAHNTYEMLYLLSYITAVKSTQELYVMAPPAWLHVLIMDKAQ